MRKSLRHFLKICVDNLPLAGPVYEFGALQVTGAPEENLRGIFRGFEYTGADMREGDGVDIVLDLHDIKLPDGTASTIVCMDTLEHVEFPRKAMDEMWRVLGPNGVAIISSVFDFPIHDYPNDYWRFTPEGFKSLLKRFNHSFVGSFGLTVESPQTIVGIGFKGNPPPLDDFMIHYQNWETWNNALMKEAAKQVASVE
jgi:SAM-dependent methyltransferase